MSLSYNPLTQTYVDEHGQHWTSYQAALGYSLGQSDPSHQRTAAELALAQQQAYLAQHQAQQAAVITVTSTGTSASGGVTTFAGYPIQQYMGYNGLLGGGHDPTPLKIEHAGIHLGEIIAWRCWRLERGLLRSMAVDHVWAPDEPMEGDISASLGVHAWKKLSDAMGYYGGSRDIVIGTVALWGEVVEHEKGYRAEYAKINSLDYLFDDDWGWKRNPKLQRLRECYLGEKAQPAAWQQLMNWVVGRTRTA